MATDLTFEQVNNLLGIPVFSFNGTNIKLDANLVTGDSYSGLHNEGVIEFCFKLLKACYDTQQSVNGTNNPTPLTSFSPPFYSTVTQGTPPTIQGSITVTGVIPLDINNLTGSN